MVNPAWYDEDSDEIFLCLEFPDGFQGEVLNRKQDQELLDDGDERPLAAGTDSHGTNQPKGWFATFFGWLQPLRG